MGLGLLNKIKGKKNEGESEQIHLTLIANGEIKVRETPKGKMIEINLTQDQEKKSKIAYY